MSFNYYKLPYKSEDVHYFSQLVIYNFNMQQIKDSIQISYEQPTEINIRNLSKSINFLFIINEIPGIFEEIFKKSNDFTIQLDNQLIKLKNYNINNDTKIELQESICRFFRCIQNLPSLKVEVQKKKIDTHAQVTVPDLNILDYLSDILKQNNPDLSFSSIYALIILLKYYENSKKKEEIPNWAQFKKFKATDPYIQKWFFYIENLLNFFVENNPKFQILILDFLQFLTNIVQKRLKIEIISTGILGILVDSLNKSDSAVTQNVLQLIILLTKNDPESSDILCKIQCEPQLMNLLTKFHDSPKITDLIGQTLEMISNDVDPLDLENFDETISVIKEKLIKFIQQKETNDIQKALQNIEIIRFYSLLQQFTRKLMTFEIDFLLVEMIQKCLKLETEEMVKQGINIFYEKLLGSTLMILNRILKLPEIYTPQNNNSCEFMLVPYLIMIIRTKQSMQEVIYYSLDCILVLIETSTKKQIITEFHNQNLLPSLIHLSDIYKYNKQFTHMINQLIPLQKSKETLVIIPKQSKKTLEINLEYLNCISETPETAEQFLKTGVGVLLKFLAQECDCVKSLKPHLISDIDEHIYDLQIIQYSSEKKNNYTIIEIIRKFMTHKSLIEKYMSEVLLSEVLLFVRLYSEEREPTICGLRVISLCASCLKTREFVIRNKGVESIFIVLNQQPTDKDIQELAGSILQLLDSENLQVEVKCQYDELTASFDPNDADSLDSIQQANIYLSNLCSSIPDEETQEIIDQNLNVIQNIEKFFIPGVGVSFYASVLLLISRLGCQGDDTKIILRKSQIPSKIIQIILLNEELMNTETILSELALESLTNMIGGDQEVLPHLDIHEGSEIIHETPQTLQDHISPLDKNFSANNFQAFVLLINQLELGLEGQENSKAISLIGETCTLLARIIQCQQQFALIFFEKEGGQLMIEIFLKLCDMQKSQSIKYIAFTKLSKLIAQLGKVGPFFFEILCHPEILQPAQESLLNIRINDELIHNINSLDLIKIIMCYFKVMLKNDFDKSKIVLSNIHQTIVKVIERLMELKEDYIKSPHLCSVLREALNCLLIMLHDPIILHDLKKHKYYDILINFIDNVAVKSQEQVQEYDEIEGDTNSLARVFEVLYTCLEYQFKDDQKVVQFIGKKYNQNSKLFSIPGVYGSPYLLVKVLNIFYYLIITQNTQMILQKIKEDTLIFKKSKYSKIPYIVKLFKQLDEACQFLAQGKYKDLELLKNKVYDLDIQIAQVQSPPLQKEVSRPQEYKDVIKEEIPKRREAKADVMQQFHQEPELTNEHQSMQILHQIDQELENLINQFGGVGYSQIDQQRFTNVLERIRAYAQDNKTTLQVHQIGITEGLLNTLLILDAIVDISIQISITICHLMKFEQAIREAQVDFCDPIVFFLGLNLQNPVVTTNILKTLNCFLFKEQNIQLFIKKNCTHLISNLINKQQDVSVLCECANIVDKLAQTDQLAVLLVPVAKIETIQFLYQKHTTIYFLQSFALLVGTICRNEVLQLALGGIQIHKKLVNDLKQYPGDIQLAINTFYALSFIAYNNRIIADQLMSTEILDISRNYLQKFTEKHVLVETICSMYSNITYKNDNNKKIIGDKQIIPELITALYIYTSQIKRNKTIKQILRVLGNCALIYNISQQIINLDFVVIINDYCVGLKYIETGDNIKYLLDVITNLSQYPDQKNNALTSQMYKQGVVGLVINCLRENQLNQEILKSGIDTIDNMIQNQVISTAFIHILDMITKVIKTQDGNIQIISSSLRLIWNFCNVQTNRDLVLKLPLTEIILHILKKIDEKQQVQGLVKVEKVSDKFSTCVFKLLNLIASDQSKLVGVVSCIGYALRIRGQTREDVQNYIAYVRLLQTLSNKKNLQKQIATECIAFTIARSLEFRENLEFGNSCMIIFEQLFLDPGNIIEIVNNDGIELMASILKKIYVNEQTLQLVFKCIYQLCLNEKYRKMCLESQCYNYINIVIKNTKYFDGTLLQKANITLFSMINERDEVRLGGGVGLSQEAFNYLVNGVNCIMLRKDGSYKNGIIYLTNDKKYLCGKKQKGEIKEKYTVDISQISDYKFNYVKDSKAWEYSVFKRFKGKEIKSTLCVSIFGQIFKNDIVSLNFILTDENVKQKFSKCFYELIDTVKTQ